MCLYFTRIMSKTEAMLAALRRENNRYLAAIANVSAVVEELAGSVEALVGKKLITYRKLSWEYVSGVGPVVR